MEVMVQNKVEFYGPRCMQQMCAYVCDVTLMIVEKFWKRFCILSVTVSFLLVLVVQQVGHF